MGEAILRDFRGGNRFECGRHFRLYSMDDVV